MLGKIPQTVRKGKERRASPYKPQCWRGFVRSPIRTRSRCQQQDKKFGHREDDDEDDRSCSSFTDSVSVDSSSRKAGTTTTSSSGNADAAW